MPGDSVLKIVLIVMIVFLLIFGGLGGWFISQVGSKGKPDTLDYKLNEVEKRITELTGRTRKGEQLKERDRDVAGNITRIRILGRIPELERKIEETDLATAVTNWSTQLIEYHSERLERDWQHNLKLKDIRRTRHQKLSETRQRVAEYIERDPEGGPCLQTVRAKKDEFEGRYHERRTRLQTFSDDITKELEKQKHRYTRRVDDKRKERSRKETEYVQIREELQNYMVREPPEVDKGFDGRVITVDVAARGAVIDMGERQGVKANMRFRVFQIRQGGRQVHKGFVVVRSVSRESANCIIMDMAINLPRCPPCGYTARYPEERFCPHHLGAGAAGARVQKLNAIPKETNIGMNREDPIVAGDLVKNPFFMPGRQLRFAVAGEPDNPLSLNYTTEDFVRAIRWHGGVIDPKVGARTDILLAGKYATEEVRKARDLGVRILYQYEAFDFLRE